MTLSQRATHHSDPEDLDRDGDTRDVAQIKRTTAVDTTRRIYLGVEKYHAVPGCSRGEWEAATIADAIEQNTPPCQRCGPPDYRDGTTVASEEETTGQNTQARVEDRANQHTNTDESTLPLPDTKPTKPSDIDPFVRARGSIRRTVHIPASSDPTEPLCVVIGTYNGTGEWTIKSHEAHPNLDERFDLCQLCLAAYDRRRHGGEHT
jgi:hypothetical protein